MNKLTLKTISLKDLWNVFRGCFLFVIAAVLLVTSLLYVHAKVNYVPMYSSQGTLYLINENTDSEQSKNEWTVDYTLANVVIEDTMYLLKSRTVLNAVGEEVGISNGYGSLRSSITISNPEDTRVLEITATASSPELAKNIVDTLSKVGPEAAEKQLSYGNLRVFEEGTVNNWPVNGVSFMGFLKFGLIAGVAVYIVFLCMFLFDNYIHTEEDIERYLGLSVIGEIPDADAPKKKNKYARYKYKKRNSKQYYGGHGYYGSSMSVEIGDDGKKEGK